MPNDENISINLPSSHALTSEAPFPYALKVQSLHMLQIKSHSNPQNPGGFNRWLTLVHFGSSAFHVSVYGVEIFHSASKVIENSSSRQSACDGRSYAQKRILKLTMHPLPISLLLPVEHGVLVPRQHLLLCRHLLFPSLDRPCREALFR